jgi:hypothetical protein
MKLIILAALLMITSRAICDDLKSPDGKYEVEYHKSLPHESNVKFKNTKTGKVLGDAFSNGYDSSSYLETAWSPDSRYLAVVARGTRTTSEIEIFAFSDDSVEQIRLPDYRLNLLGRRQLMDGGRYHWVSKLRWDATTITFYCTGQWMDGSGDPAVDPSNWYHFDVSLDFGGPDSTSDPRWKAMTALEQKRKAE